MSKTKSRPSGASGGSWETSELRHPPMNVFEGDLPFGVRCTLYQTGGDGCGGIQYDRLTFEVLSNIDRQLGSLCALVKATREGGEKRSMMPDNDESMLFMVRGFYMVLRGKVPGKRTRAERGHTGA